MRLIWHWLYSILHEPFSSSNLLSHAKMWSAYCAKSAPFTYILIWCEKGYYDKWQMPLCVCVCVSNSKSTIIQTQFPAVWRNVFMSFTFYIYAFRNVTHKHTLHSIYCWIVSKGAHNFYCHNVSVRNLSQFIFSVSNYSHRMKIFHLII